MPLPESVSFVDGLVLVLVLGVMSEGEEVSYVRLVRLNVGTDEADYRVCAPLVQGGRSIVPDKWDSGKDGVSD